MMKNLKDSKITVYFDQRRSLKDGTFPIKLRLYHKGKERPLPLGKSCNESHWIYKDRDSAEYIRAMEKGEFRYVSTKHPNSARLNHSINASRQVAERFLEKNADRIDRLTADQVKELLTAKLANPEQEDHTLGKRSSTVVESFSSILDSLEKSESWGYHKIYTASLSVWSQFIKAELGMHDLELIHISKGTLNRLMIVPVLWFLHGAMKERDWQ